MGRGVELTPSIFFFLEKRKLLIPTSIVVTVGYNSTKVRDEITVYCINILFRFYQTLRKKTSSTNTMLHYF